MRAAGGCFFRNPERVMQGAATPVRRCAFFAPISTSKARREYGIGIERNALLNRIKVADLYYRSVVDGVYESYDAFIGPVR